MSAPRRWVERAGQSAETSRRWSVAHPRESGGIAVGVVALIVGLMVLIGGGGDNGDTSARAGVTQRTLPTGEVIEVPVETSTSGGGASGEDGNGKDPANGKAGKGGSTAGKAAVAGSKSGRGSKQGAASSGSKRGAASSGSKSSRRSGTSRGRSTRSGRAGGGSGGGRPSGGGGGGGGGAAAAPQTAGPVPTGTYRYDTSGKEFPSVTTLTVSDAGQGLQRAVRNLRNDNGDGITREQTISYSGGAVGLDALQISGKYRIYDRSWSLSPQGNAQLLPAGAGPGSSWSFTMSGSGVTSSVSNSAAGSDSVSVAGQSVPCLRIESNIRYSGSLDGSSDVTTCVTAGGLIVREHWRDNIKFAVGSSSSEYTATLQSLNPS